MEAKGYQSDAVFRGGWGGGALKEKVTSHPPVRADATSEIFGRAGDYRYWAQEMHLARPQG